MSDDKAGTQGHVRCKADTQGHPGLKPRAIIGADMERPEGAFL